MVYIKMQFIIYFKTYVKKIYVFGKFFENKLQIWIKFIHDFMKILNIKLHQPFMKNII